MSDTKIEVLSNDGDGLVQIRGPIGTRIITAARLAEIIDESYRIGRRGRGGTKEQCRKIFDQLIEQEIAGYAS
jgi:hypothetical protein